MSQLRGGIRAGVAAAFELDHTFLNDLQLLGQFVAGFEQGFLGFLRLRFELGCAGRYREPVWRRLRRLRSFDAAFGDDPLSATPQAVWVA